MENNEANIENHREIFLLIMFGIYAIIGIILFLPIDVIENDSYDSIFWDMTFITFTFVIVTILILRKKISKYLNSKESELYSLYILFFIALFLGNMGMMSFINTFGEQKIRIIETPIIKSYNGSSRKGFYIKLLIDGEEVEIDGRVGKVGEMYKLKIYEGCLGITYFKDEECPK